MPSTRIEGMLMELVLAVAGAGHSLAPSLRPRRAAVRLEPVPHAHPGRAAFEQFIAARFHRAYGARVTHFCAQLLGVRDGLAQWRAAAGYTPGAGHRLFLEQYLDLPIEVALAHGWGRPAARGRIAEVGNLAAVSSGMARALIPLLARHLHRLGYEWAVFTATRELRNSFRRLGLNPLRLARADPARLPDGGASWGEYYACDPCVMAGKIAHALPAAARA